MKQFSSNELNLLKELEINSSKPMRTAVNGIYIEQSADDPMWISCVVSKQPFQYVCSAYGNNWNRMVQNGLNCNMMTRDRWFDINQIVDVLEVSGKTIIETLNISYAQYRNWNLTTQEMIKLKITLVYIYNRYGKDTFMQEYIKLGSIDLKLALSNKQLYGMDFEFLKKFKSTNEVKQLRWSKYYHTEHEQKQVNDKYADILLKYEDDYEFSV